MTASARGRANRRRGAAAERSVVAWLRHNGYPDARRTLAGDGRQAGDVDGVQGLTIEVKDVDRSAWPTWMRQAEEQANGGAWVVVRRTRGNPDVGAWPCRWWTPTDDSDDQPWTFGEFIDCWLDDLVTTKEAHDA